MLSDSLCSWLVIVSTSLLFTVVMFWGLCGFAHWWFYTLKRDQAAEWKLQPRRFLSDAVARGAFIGGSANMFFGSFISGTFVWYIVNGGWSAVYFDVSDYGLLWLPVSAVVLFFMVDAGFYYSHRALHTPLLYRLIHHHHHRYVAPVVFAASAMHVVEFLTFEAILMLPAFVLPVHWAVYLAVILYTNFVGMVDHSGIRVQWPFPFHGDNRFHDDHHAYSYCNFGLHSESFDRLHGTIRTAKPMGTCKGWNFRFIDCVRRRNPVAATDSAEE
jgi:Delta7-sterol 5-desaturase